MRILFANKHLAGRLKASRLFCFLLFWLVLVVLAQPLPASAVFDPNFLLSDQELTDGSALSKTGVQQFLSAKGGGIATAVFESVAGPKTAAEIIFDAGTYYRISQKFLIVLLQKEQSLISTRTPTKRQYDWATGFAVCDSCSTDDPIIQKYRGFFNQVNWAAKRIRETYLPLLERTGRVFSFGPGITTIVDGVSVTPENDATAALYTYTPHLHGNENFVRLWDTWFFRRFPEGTLLREATSENYYLIDGGKKRHFRSLAVLASSYDPKKALLAASAELAAYEEGAPIVFPNYSLIQSPRGTIFLIANGVKRGIATREAFRTLGFNPEEVEQASWEDINYYPDGPVIDLGSAYPAGALLQSATTGGVAYVENGIRHPIFAREILTSSFKGRPITRASQEEIEGYPAGNTVLFQDGELVSSQGSRSVYFISEGQKLPIASRQAFDRLGFQWSNIVWTSQHALDIHPTGEPLDFEEVE